MSTITTHSNLIKIYDNSKSSIGKQMYSYISVSYKDILAIDDIKTNVTGTQ